MAKVTLVLEDRPDGSVSTVMDAVGETFEEGSLSPALLYGMTFRALQESELIDDHAVIVLNAVKDGVRPSTALRNYYHA